MTTLEAVGTLHHLQQTGALALPPMDDQGMDVSVEMFVALTELAGRIEDCQSPADLLTLAVVGLHRFNDKQDPNRITANQLNARIREIQAELMKWGNRTQAESN